MLLVIRSGLVISHCLPRLGLGHTSYLQSFHSVWAGTGVVTVVTRVTAIPRHFLAWSSHTAVKLKCPAEIVRLNLVEILLCNATFR